MNGRLVVLPSGSQILSRSISYGAAYGAATGAIVAVPPAAFVAAIAPLFLIVAPIAAAAGAIFGVVCGLVGGLSLVAFRRQVGTSRVAVRLVAGVGAGLPPATCLVALMISTGQPWRPILATLTVVVVVLAAAIGPYAFFGRPRRRRRTHRPAPVQRES